MTTTGYGADSPWEAPWMNLLVVLMQLSGVAIGFFTLRVLIIPLFKRTPVRLGRRLRPKDEHVVVGEYRWDVPYNGDGPHRDERRGTARSLTEPMAPNVSPGEETTGTDAWIRGPFVGLDQYGTVEHEYYRRARSASRTHHHRRAR